MTVKDPGQRWHLPCTL